MYGNTPEVVIGKRQRGRAAVRVAKKRIKANKKQDDRHVKKLKMKSNKQQKPPRVFKVEAKATTWEPPMFGGRR